MRTTRDCIRHAISSELIGLALVTPLGAWAFGMPVADIGLVGVGAATLATIWNYVYNLGFDSLMQRLTGGTWKSVLIRILNVVLFEAGLLMVLMPLIAWYLGIGLMQAFMMDVAFAIFSMVYAFVFNWGYDKVFPSPAWQDASQAGHAAM